jgi:hypothetical protein
MAPTIHGVFFALPVLWCNSCDFLAVTQRPKKSLSHQNVTKAFNDFFIVIAKAG